MAEPGLRRVLETALIAAAAALLGWSAWGAWHDWRLPRQLTKVQLGMDRKAAEALLGRAGWEGDCGGYVPYLQRENCARELGYSSAFAPLRPVYYIVQLDRSGHVVEAAPVHSE